ncbi:MAG: type I-B CRISPR-associated protein Cas5 [Candidatus Aenigmarchaeota archaeon]|nr:type I-B CRISPR-associated protein Cas5 [Candidatus Aenigmarchaeota archaeon]
MSKVLQILVSSEFALFKRNDSNEFALTYNFPPKTQILGLLGAIIGLSGYSKNESKADFYEKLKGFKVAIIPVDENNKAVTEPPKKTVITYNNYHGYGSMEEGGILQVREQLLIEPRYRIFIFGEGEYYDKLKKKLEMHEYFYTPYLGKNEFLAVVEYEGEKDAIKTTKGNIKISSIFLRDYGIFAMSERGNRNEIQFIIVEEYPVSFDTNYLYQKKIVIYSDGMHIPNYEKVEKDGFRILEVEGQHLFFI